jgi:hypothetical protein
VNHQGSSDGVLKRGLGSGAVDEDEDVATAAAMAAHQRALRRLRKVRDEPHDSKLNLEEDAVKQRDIDLEQEEEEEDDENNDDDDEFEHAVVVLST